MTVPTREIRHQIPARIVAGLDGKALAKGIDRGELLTRILQAWFDQEFHEATMFLRFAGGNGSDSDSKRNDSP